MADLENDFLDEDEELEILELEAAAALKLAAEAKDPDILKAQSLKKPEPSSSLLDLSAWGKSAYNVGSGIYDMATNAPSFLMETPERFAKGFQEGMETQESLGGGILGRIPAGFNEAMLQASGIDQIPLDEVGRMAAQGVAGIGGSMLPGGPVTGIALGTAAGPAYDILTGKSAGETAENFRQDVIAGGAAGIGRKIPDIGYRAGANAVRAGQKILGITPIEMTRTGGVRQFCGGTSGVLAVCSEGREGT